MLNKFREAEAVIPYREQNHREHFHQGESIRAVLNAWRKRRRTAAPAFAWRSHVRKGALQARVPEIQQGVVEIRAAAREVGSRTKIAVFSRDDAIDRWRVRGLKGARVQAVVTNSRRAHRHCAVVADTRAFSPSSRSPRRVSRACSVNRQQDDSGGRRRDQLSLAIGATGRMCDSRQTHGLEDRPVLEREWLEPVAKRSCLRRCPTSRSLRRQAF